jgi:hypothetical protein
MVDGEKIRKAKEEEVHPPQSGLIGGYANFFARVEPDSF